jgi:hypothetical protein
VLGQAVKSPSRKIDPGFLAEKACITDTSTVVSESRRASTESWFTPPVAQPVAVSFSTQASTTASASAIVPVLPDSSPSEPLHERKHDEIDEVPDDLIDKVLERRPTRAQSKSSNVTCTYAPSLIELLLEARPNFRRCVVVWCDARLPAELSMFENDEDVVHSRRESRRESDPLEDIMSHEHERASEGPLAAPRQRDLQEFLTAESLSSRSSARLPVWRRWMLCILPFARCQRVRMWFVVLWFQLRRLC